MLGRSTAIAAAIALALSLPAASAARGDSSDSPPDFSGTWRLDPSKSDLPRRPEMGGRPGGGFRGGWMGGGGRRGGWGGGMGRGGDAQGDRPDGAQGGEGRGPRMGWLPGFLRIAQTHAEVEFADSAGAEVREIALEAEPYDSTRATSKIPRDPGEWNKNKLDVEHLGPMDAKIREEFSLEDGGQTLVIKTQVEGGRGGGREMKRVYRKVSAS